MRFSVPPQSWRTERTPSRSRAFPRTGCRVRRLSIVKAFAAQSYSASRQPSVLMRIALDECGQSRRERARFRAVGDHERPHEVVPVALEREQGKRHERRETERQNDVQIDAEYLPAPSMRAASSYSFGTSIMNCRSMNTPNTPERPGRTMENMLSISPSR